MCEKYTGRWASVSPEGGCGVPTARGSEVVGRQQESNSGQKQQALLTPGHLQPFILLSAVTASTVSLRFLKN